MAAMEIASADGIICIKYNRVIGNGIQFHFGQFFQMQPGIARSAMHLRHAAE